ncbi:response regulator [Aurantibacillus circumpalustris]|uniref:response regulator n=1 Tax=Aurantibacillus circumpalustris TaxID=3036359 RepID=UPI00295BF596|nr:response regulator [Aurantibacillus circumpalustris]
MKKNILIIDDSESIREVIAAGLESAGYNVTKGINGQDGLTCLENNPSVECIITDLNMPIMDGITFLKEVRKSEKHKYLPIIILTTESQEAKKQEARTAGATGWIIKPFSKEKLINVIKKVVR